jgi:hypothetical protein
MRRFQRVDLLGATWRASPVMKGLASVTRSKLHASIALLEARRLPARGTTVADVAVVDETPDGVFRK